MSQRPVQFSLESLFVVMLWAAVLLGAWRILPRILEPLFADGTDPWIVPGWLLGATFTAQVIAWVLWKSLYEPR